MGVSMFNILTLNNISDYGLKKLPLENFVVSDKTDNPHGVLVRSADMHNYSFPESLLAVARAGAGVNNIPLDKCSEKGIVVFNTPGANANAVKELVITGLLLSSRKIVDGINWVQTLEKNDKVPKIIEEKKSEFTGPEILNKKLGVIGLGAIGVLVANTANSLGMEVQGFDPFISVDSAWNLSRGVQKAHSVAEILLECDYISIHVPLNDKTRHMFNDEAFAKIKKGSRLLNFSRGELVDNKALIRAIESEQIDSYVTDFPNEELIGVKNIITIPHLGASTPESEENCAEMAAIQLKNYLEYGNIENGVNLPNCTLPYSGKKRICVVNRNIPNVVGALATALASKGMNIDNMINKSKGDYAYTIIDIDNTELNGIGQTIKAIDGVILVRII